MTELAYLSDMPSAYVREFRARLVARPPGAVVLDRTYFYPTGGGQPSDRGTLELADGSRADVVDVTKSGSAVVHRLEALPTFARSLAPDAEVLGRIDWTRRHAHMRLHTAQHLVSARIFLATRLRTRRASLGGTRATLDLEGPLPPGVLPAVADEVRAVIGEPRPVVIRLVPRSDWDRHPLSERSGLVSLPPQVDPVRVIAIEGQDTCPCGGTHVRSTGEIGDLEFAPLRPGLTGSTRVEFRLVETAPTTPTA